MSRGSIVVRRVHQQLGYPRHHRQHLVLSDGVARAQAGHFAVLVLSLVPGLPTTDMPALGWTTLAGTPTVDTASSGNLLAWTKTLTSGDIGATLNIGLDSSCRYATGC
ncbi:hypothetical protein ACQPWW_17390 [Micromonospora sp. CA-240977]|uniref:hypothetical protein n=1 Tax=Micromonospora sp. CA-240977 TaxID=3239957 RepID=UPI003D90AE31